MWGLVTLLARRFFKLVGFMNAELVPSENCLSLITKFEGYRSDPYLCPAGYLTVGIGTRLSSEANVSAKVLEGLKKDFYKKYPNGVSLSEAKDLLLRHLTLVAEPAIKLHVKVKLSQNQFDALLSFIYNLGVDAFLTSTLLKMINSGDLEGAALQFRLWNKATVNGRLVVEGGLTRRRTAEELLFEGKSWQTI